MFFQLASKTKLCCSPASSAKHRGAEELLGSSVLLGAVGAPLSPVRGSVPSGPCSRSDVKQPCRTCGGAAIAMATEHNRPRALAAGCWRGARLEHRPGPPSPLGGGPVPPRDTQPCALRSPRGSSLPSDSDDDSAAQDWDRAIRKGRKNIPSCPS